MHLRLARHLWGVDISAGYEPHLAAWRATGYELLETSVRNVPDAAAFHRVIRDEGFGWIGQAFTNWFTPGGTVRAHLDSLREQIEEHVPHAPLFINVHSGADSWSHAEALDFYGEALALEKHYGFILAHETHRMRVFGNPWATAAVLKEFPDLKITCDFSHWVCIAERLLPDCADIIRLAARHCHHIHARVGFEEGPQVPDPRAPEYAAHLAAHESWWDIIRETQSALGRPAITLTPEFGPPPYLHTQPFTQTPLADLTEICDWMALRQKSRFGS
jgi:hypothetical protein